VVTGDIRDLGALGAHAHTNIRIERA
jgi:hypothetical protein